eukprot:SAG11_NODE_261_length_11530_cov_8.418861_2_plen_134_part_00
MGKVDVKQEAEAASLTGDATQVPSTKKGCRFRVPFALMLALAYSVLITTSGLIIFSQMQSSSKSSQERMFTVSKGNVNDIVRDLQGELAEKIGLKVRICRPSLSRLLSSHHRPPTRCLCPSCLLCARVRCPPR